MIRLAVPALGAEEAEAVARVLQSGWLVQGARVAEFEDRLKGPTGSPFVAACSSGTAALQLALAALDLRAGARMILPDYTFPATINAVLLAGLEPVVVDVEAGTWNLVEGEVAELLEGPSPPEALLAVHQFGLPAPLRGLLPTAARVGTRVVEDAACALGASLELDGGPVAAGAIGELACFSFHPRKIVTTGEGGAVSTADAAVDTRVRRLRNHGMEAAPGGLAFVEPGWNLRMSELHAAVGVAQMDRLEALLADRARIAAGYAERLAPLLERGLLLPRVPEGAHPTWQSYVVLLPEGCRVEAVSAAMRARGVEANLGAHALHEHPAYRDLPGLRRAYPGATAARARGLSLPVATGLSGDDLDRVASALAASIDDAAAG